jgi:DHA1 family chloramphenicol resistance protein-like MFS transporter
MLTETTGIRSDWVPAVLLGYGIGALIGITLGGRTADRYPRAILGIGFAGLFAVSLALALTGTHPVATVVLVVVLGFVGFLTNPALNSRFAAIAPSAPTLAMSGNVAAFNVGITLGPWLGGIALSAGFGYPAIPAIGAAIATLALILWSIDLALQKRPKPMTSTHASTRKLAKPTTPVP